MKALAAAFFVMAMSNAVYASSFKVPSEKPALTVVVPDKWRPNYSEDGVDAVSPDSSTFLSVSAFKTDDRVAARDDALAILSRNGMTIDRTSPQENVRPVAGLTATQTVYSATEDKTTKQVVIMVTPIAGKRCLQIAEWGTPDGFKRNAEPLSRILASIKLLGTGSR